MSRIETFKYTTRLFSLIISMFSFLVTTPPPQAKTQFLFLYIFLITLVSNSLKDFSPYILKISLISFSWSNSITLSKSINKSPSFFARIFPIVLFPDPIKPMREIFLKSILTLDFIKIHFITIIIF